MNVHADRSAGFTIIELSLVLIVLGILAVALAPMIQVVHDDSMRERDMATMETARKALLGYIRIHEGVPCVDASGSQVASGCDPESTLDLLGVRTTDSRRMTFALDVNDTLTIAGLGASGNTLCEALADIIDPPVPPPIVPEPAICASGNANTGNTACIANNPMAIVMAGRGSDRCFNLENSHASASNDPVCPTAVADNRVFENPARLHSRTQDDGYYEDLVETVTPVELAQLMGCAAGGSGNERSICESGETYIQASYGDNSGWLGVRMNGVCYAVGAGTMAALGCVVDGTAMELRSNASCTGSSFYSGLAEDLDTSGDGRADIVCNNTACVYR
jgi:prepilin-type N-terminal cleavage/methylation domain-containing protein